MKTLKHPMTNEGISSYIDTFKKQLRSYGVGKNETILLSLTVEETLLQYQNRSGHAIEFESAYRKKHGMLRCILTIPGEAYDPFEKGSLLLLNYLEKLKFKPEWSYENGKNQIMLPVFLQETLPVCLKLLFKYLKGSRRSLVLASIVQLFNFAAVVLLPLCSAQLIIQITDSQFLQFIYTGAAILVANSLNDLCVYVRNICISKASKDMLNALETGMVRTNFSIQNHCIDSNGSGIFIQRLTTDTEKLAESFRKMIEQTGILLPFVGILISAFFINPLVCAFMIVCKLILGILEYKRTNSQNRDDRKARGKSDSYYGIVSESIRGAKDIKLLNTEEKFLQKISDTIKNMNQSKIERVNHFFRGIDATTL